MKKQQGAAQQASPPRQSQSPIGSQQNVSSSHASSTAVRDLGPTIQSIEDELESEGASGGYANAMPTYDYGYATNQAVAFVDNGISDHHRDYRQDYGSNVAREASPYYSQEVPQRAAYNIAQHFTDVAAADNFPECSDKAVQTEVTDEEMLLRLLRTMPELLDLVRVTMRQ